MPCTWPPRMATFTSSRNSFVGARLWIVPPKRETLPSTSPHWLDRRRWWSYCWSTMPPWMCNPRMDSLHSTWLPRRTTMLWCVSFCPTEPTRVWPPRMASPHWRWPCSRVMTKSLLSSSRVILVERSGFLRCTLPQKRTTSRQRLCFSM